MLNPFKSVIERLETAVTSAKRDLDKVASQHEAAVIRAAELADQVASAFADDAQNAEALEQQHFQAELRVKSLKTAAERAAKRHSVAQHELDEAKKQAKADAAATKCRDLAKALEQARRPAAEAARKFVDIWGSFPAIGYYPAHVQQAFDLWVGSADFFAGDFVDIAVQTLRSHADEILAGKRPSDLGQTFDEQAVRFGRKPLARAS